jgi:hypothetical protein
MIMGQAAGVAAAMAAGEGKAVHLIDVHRLQDQLREDGQVLSLKCNTYGAFRYTDEIVIDNNMKRFTSKTGPWNGIETSPEGRYQMNYARNDKGRGSFIFKPWLAKAGTYELSIWYPSVKSCSDAVPLIINHRNGTTNKFIDQRKNGGKWIPLGSFEFESGHHEVLTLSADGVEGEVVADAIKLKFIQ